MKTASKGSLWPLRALLLLLAGVLLLVFFQRGELSPVLTPSQASPASPPKSRVKFTIEKAGKLPEIDLRPVRTKPAQVPDERVAAVGKLRQELPNLQVTFDEISGAPSFLQATGKFLTGKQPGKSARNLVEGYVDKHHSLFGHDGAALERARGAGRRDGTQPDDDVGVAAAARGRAFIPDDFKGERDPARRGDHAE